MSRSSWQAWSPDQRLAWLHRLTTTEKALLRYDWGFWARPAQLPPPGDWLTWFIKAGRGFGKTRTGAETVNALVRTGICGRLALIAETAADARDVMVEGESGVLACAPPWCRPKYEPSKRRLTWPNGAIATTYSGDDPEQLRGPQHDGGWIDEIAKMRYAADTWSNYLFGLRLGADPRTLITSTPRPIPIIREILADSLTVVTGGNSYENLENLAPVYRRNVIDRYAGTRLGRQELNAEVLDDTPGALWTLRQIEATRVRRPPELTRIVIGVDPKSGKGSSDEGGSPGETGIIVAGRGVDGHGYTLDDRSTGGGPGEWAPAVLRAYHDWHADAIVVETNNGGAMVAHVLRLTEGGANVPILEVWASRGKQTRAEPAAMLMEQGRDHHVGTFPALEDQLTTYVPNDDSPDRMDAKVWAYAELFPSEADLGGSYASGGARPQGNVR